jgi:hypothetical protein
MRRRARARAAALTAAALAAAAAQAGGATLPTAATSEDVIFRDALLGNGWREGGTAWSWSGAAVVTPGRGRRGGAALCAALGGWGGASLVRTPGAPPLPPASLLLFWLAPSRRGAPALNLTAIQLVRHRVEARAEGAPIRPRKGKTARAMRFRRGHSLDAARRCAPSLAPLLGAHGRGRARRVPARGHRAAVALLRRNRWRFRNRLRIRFLGRCRRRCGCGRARPLRHGRRGLHPLCRAAAGAGALVLEPHIAQGTQRALVS